MLSIQIKPISSGSNAAKYYFAKDNYYFSSKLETSWQGEASNRLGLKGEVQLDDLEKMLDGRLPNGVVVGNDSHRCGYDLTFCASKSHSYLALVCGKREFIEIHNKAVKTVLNLIQEHAAEARKTINGDLTFEKTKNLSFATINHDTSRDLDPFLHTHALLMNLTQRLDGEWRALASDISQNHGTMEWISKNKIFLALPEFRWYDKI